jgi:hypothetical protein
MTQSRRSIGTGDRLEAYTAFAVVRLADQVSQLEAVCYAT